MKTWTETPVILTHKTFVCIFIICYQIMLHIVKPRSRNLNYELIRTNEIISPIEEENGEIDQEDDDESFQQIRDNRDGGTYLDEIIDVPEDENGGFSFRTLWAFTGKNIKMIYILSYIDNKIQSFVFTLSSLIAVCNTIWNYRTT